MHSAVLCSYMTTHCSLVCVIFVALEDAQSKTNQISDLILVSDFKAGALFVYLFQEGKGNRKRYHNLTVYLEIGQTVMQHCLEKTLVTEFRVKAMQAKCSLRVRHYVKSVSLPSLQVWACIQLKLFPHYVFGKHCLYIWPVLCLFLLTGPNENSNVYSNVCQLPVSVIIMMYLSLIVVLYWQHRLHFTSNNVIVKDISNNLYRTE